MKEFIKELKKEFGDDIIERENKDLRVIKTSSLALDLSIGVGGIPKTKFTEIFGPEGSGKTTLALELCKNTMNDGENVLFVDVENMLDAPYTEFIVGYKFGEDNMIITNTITDAVMVVVQPETGEDSLNIVERGLLSDEFSLIIIDSVGALAPKREKEKELEKATVAETPRLLSKFLRRVAFFVRRNDVAVVFINQVRDKIGSYIGGYESPGGHALKHYTSVRIQLGKGKAILQDSDKIGVLTPFTVKKNKVAPPFRSYTFPIIYGKGIDNVRDIVLFAKFLGVVKTRGSHYIFEEDEHIGHGLNNVVESLENDKLTLDRIEKVCYNSVLGEQIDEVVEE